MPSQNSLEKSRHQGLPSNLSSFAFTSRCAIAGRSSFLYAVRERTIGALYIGQTRNPAGALGRFAQHLSWDTNSNTFRQRVLAVFNVDEIEFTDVELLGVVFPDEERYQNAARDYREAVESLVHDYVLAALTSSPHAIGLCLVSRAYRHPYRNDKDVIAIAKRMGSDICEWVLSTSP